MSNGLVTCEIRDNVAVIQMDDGKVNALSYDMLAALNDALDTAEAEAKALVLVGRPGRFCAGFDLKSMTESPASAVRLLTAGCDVFMRLYGFDLPVVIASSGHAIAGGALLTLCGDYRVGVEGEFKYGLNEVAIKMPLPILGVELARDRLAKHALNSATLGAKLFDPTEAVDAGYLDLVVPPEHLLTASLKVAEGLGQYDRHAFSQTKQRLRGSIIAHILDTLEEDMSSFASRGL